jgi:hypothetical protein
MIDINMKIDYNEESIENAKRNIHKHLCKSFGVSIGNIFNRREIELQKIREVERKLEELGL